MTVSLVQNFFKQTVTTPWTTGVGNFYVSQKPSVTSGFLVISPNSESLREIVSFSAVGTDGGGDFVTVSARGLGGTTEQAHGAGEKVYMNITAQHIEQIKQAIEDINNAGALNASTTVKGVARLTASPNVVLGNPTITIASPAVVTLTAHGLTENDEIEFTTTGALPTGIVAATKYYVIGTGLTANTFQFSTTFGGAAINTSGSQSGTHTLTKVTPVAAGANDTRFPTTDQAAALVGNYGTPNSSNKYVTEQGAVEATATFGDGSDGAVTLDGTNTYAFLSKSGSVYTMTRDIYCTNLTINSGSTLEPAGFRIFVNGTFSGAGTVRYNGNNGNANSGQTAGAGGTALSTTGFFKNLAGGAGSNGGVSGGNASAAPSPTSTNPSIGVSGKRGGRGGGRNDTPDTSTAGGTATAPVLKFPVLRHLVLACLDLNNSGVMSQLLGTAASSGGGGGHGYITSNGIGGGGGGAGATGGTIFLVCKIFAGTVTFQVTGGTGGNASAIGGNGGNGGGGAGGSGGVVIVIYAIKTATPTYTLTGGTGGTAVANGQSPSIAAAGENGNTGVNYEIPIKNLL